jgi:hypothetical protein
MKPFTLWIMKWWGVLAIALVLVIAYIVLGVFITLHQKHITLTDISVPTTRVGGMVSVACYEYEGVGLDKPYSQTVESPTLVTTMHAESHWGWATWRPVRLLEVCVVDEYREKEQ